MSKEQLYENKKSKKIDIEKLHMILDDPTNEKLFSEKEKTLNSLRKRLLGYTARDKTPFGHTPETISDSLEPSVKIYEKEEERKTMLEIAEEKETEKTMETRNKTSIEEDWREVEDLYEIEKIDEEPEFIEVKPVEKKEITEETTEEEKKIEELPEWEPIPEETQPSETKDIKISEEGKKTENELLKETAEEKQEATQKLPLPIPSEKKERKHIEKEPIHIEKILKQTTEKKEATQPPVIEEKETPAETEKQPEEKEEKTYEDIFENIASVDEKTSSILSQHGFETLEKLREATIKDLTQIGIKRRIAKKIKKEVEKHYAEEERDTEDRKEKVISHAEKETAEITGSSTKKTIPSGKLIETEEKFQDFQDITLEETKEVDKKIQQHHHKDEKHILDELTEWDSYDLEEETHTIAEEDRTEEKTSTSSYTFDGYTLYKKEVKTISGKKRTVYFFSREKPKEGEPAILPDGFEVRVNKITGLPYLKKKKNKQHS